MAIDPALDGLAATPSPTEPGPRHPARQGPLGRLGYAGPVPIRPHGPHAYVFQRFALDRPIGLEARFTRDELVATITGDVVGRARPEGTYGNR
ncbi:hypothetical protein RM863_03125 [Streptomyces sp. DSM 41014]|uniref:YbhB/YbcL family Raf kinase inhibitor-like protein n=1 Tax=Streptomyces hintoniae TaxID=3075521 RepID=A0ABU2UDB0_9ACTN|nr:hypothetical protein [Streptomyces sp. DSM 41014]MDT0471129.1 hypothetical protein [Streptomyces sp. DSM 41014]